MKRSSIRASILHWLHGFVFSFAATCMLSAFLLPIGASLGGLLGFPWATSATLMVIPFCALCMGASGMVLSGALGEAADNAHKAHTRRINRKARIARIAYL